LWETVYYCAQMQFGKAFRRLSRDGALSSIGPRVFYPSVRRLRKAMSPGFVLEKWLGIGAFVPPSYLTIRTLDHLAAADRRVAHWPGFRAMADHRLFLFRRN